jgi:hypothetical protein
MDVSIYISIIKNKENIRVIVMSLPKKQDIKKKSRYRKWREYKEYGEEINPGDLDKIISLNRTLRDDGKKLGIPQVSIDIYPAKYEAIASAAERGYRVKGDGTFNMPSAISFDYRAVDKLSKEELRSIAWHEMGHYIFSHFFPDIDNKYFKDYDSYLVTESFADEFAYKRFGDVYLRASEKLLILLEKKDSKVGIDRVKDLKKMAQYRKRTGKPYWLAVADTLKVKVELGHENRRIVGINPRKAVLDGLYEVS